MQTDDKQARALDLRVYLITDQRLCAELGVERTVAAAVAGGATVVQLRDHDLSDTAFVQLGRALAQQLAGTGVPLIVNDRAALVQPIGADGLHVGQGDLPPVEARRVIGSERWLGLSVHDAQQLARAVALPAGTVDHLGVGPVWQQTTKLDVKAPIGPEGLAAVVRASPWPCVGIGGIKASNVAAVRRAGAAGAAVVSAICGQPDPRAAAQELLAAWEGAA